MWKPDLTRDDVTPERIWLNRRRLIQALGAGSLAGALPFSAAAQEVLEPNTWEEITTYNNFYEFGTDKGDPVRYAGAMQTQPWTVKVDGLVDNPGDYDLTDLIGDLPTEERIYRFRCVEAWSMVIPWNGFELRALLEKVGVQDDANYVAFETAVLPEVMPGVRRPILDWPYREGLRMDEAMHPLTMLATGIYGRLIPNQNGAPMRLVVPWKYGFKSIKSIVRISLTAERPYATWEASNPREYGFYANVNPEVDHPRWSQASERVIGSGLFARRQDTLMFNGYADQVASLYEDMDLTVDF
ncbi:protein-methionine-sulfoxide reductase catalytic subunit MsrP [Jannaschia aquimarina]|uniref:Protein-methionine-sulfoxide reductase catalytic subunit MsrP n=1 Tax=Jannaschia aquimarina TaxID=935700 RepID=A0A0D1EHZ8_9RHOB|nr:protein-methionine-sulfoxide reductase catalytic subunit MsrP [Jannaschia aquimarina]KIT15465.1 Sulfoxide reductase catalytic subunit YedY precursor [Jannaschia aquimarina]SNT21965.1 sulfoxide reductase catalytic subunit YedY [Jannaschia aquimarina]